MHDNRIWNQCLCELSAVRSRNVNNFNPIYAQLPFVIRHIFHRRMSYHSSIHHSDHICWRGKKRKKKKKAAILIITLHARKRINLKKKKKLSPGEIHKRSNARAIELRKKKFGREGACVLMLLFYHARKPGTAG